MDYSKLTDQERINTLIHHRLITTKQLPINWLQLIRTIKVEPGAAVAVELIDLYVATILYGQGIVIPDELTPDVITPDYYKQLAPVLYLPSEFSLDNRNRAVRIIRIIRNLKPRKTGLLPVEETKAFQQVTNAITPQKGIQIMPVIFRGPGKFGDFSWMINQPEYNDVLFLFNDNEEQFMSFINNIGKNPLPPDACSVGGGNAVIRPYQCLNPPRAAGIPTGKYGMGYKKEDFDEAWVVIEKAFIHIIQLLRTGRYRRVAYSAALDGKTLGTDLFYVTDDIKHVILNNIEGLATNPYVLEAL